MRAISPEVSGKGSVETGVPHVIAVRDEEPVTGEKFSLDFIHGMGSCILLSLNMLIVCLRCDKVSCTTSVGRFLRFMGQVVHGVAVRELCVRG